ncbi:MAG: PAC2 family protein [Candidatus Limnocylindrales bacterium]
MSLVKLADPGDLVEPIAVAAFDGWVDSGSASTTAAERLAEGASIVATFDADRLFDYRARRPTLRIIDGRPTELDWPELTMRRTRVGERDVLILTGPEPDYCWHELADDVVELATHFGVVEWISLGAIPAAVPHTRPVPIIGTASQRGLLRGKVEAGPAGTLQVPAAVVSVLDMAITGAGIAALGYFAQVPHYISGRYPAAALDLLRAVGRHLDEAIPEGSLADEAAQLRTRLDAAALLDEQTRTYVERLEAMVDEARLPSGDELISDIERFLRDRGTGRSSNSGGGTGLPN